MLVAASVPAGVVTIGFVVAGAVNILH